MKNRIILYTLGLCLSGSMLSCTNLLDLEPEGTLTENSTFTNYNNFISYAWQFYGTFPGYDGSAPNSEFNGDLFAQAVANGTSDWIWQRVVVPSKSGDYNVPFEQIRSINVLLDNIDQARNLTEGEKKHIQSIGYFFKAYQYMALLNRYGTAIWVEHAINDGDKETLYGVPSTRDELAAKIESLLVYAAENIKVGGDGPNTVNRNVVLALTVRFGLREGTWRKYHQLGQAEKYLRLSADAGSKLLAANLPLLSDYDQLFNSESLANVPEVLLYKQYEQNQIVHPLASQARNSSGRWDLTKTAVDMYLMKDGETRWSSKQFAGDKNPYDEFRNRDTRLYYTVPPPYKVDASHPNYTWKYTADAQNREYMDLMSELSVDKRKTLPWVNWEGLILKQEPHFFDDNLGQPFCVSFTGYRFYKFSNKIQKIQNQDINDAPIFRMGEVLVSYAEAKYELGELDQSIIDKTINPLRARGGVAALQLNRIPTDPTRDATVTPELWEIRRERAVELMGEGFRFDDLRRWKKMDYAVSLKRGRYITKGVDVAANAPIPIENNQTQGYISYEGKAPGAFLPYYYLYPIPSAELVLNKNLKQNPDW
ncbi:RagB/SusD family nutrient uptake outer membrane protein [Sphingobacterium faecium]|uniref:RagB/SusD family nutrient uptake outer membrane protein n=1 Tax=Sphingobacterium faecium TaxID=34087 RepID=UPI0024691C61|nr:RagB/SusD family nutrient uptake outer membrane protein [Sphingobacterium faecium]MDH5828649.1 RagB/SusD family nutrient uptake outer membrane protein [Sphingobacterium faecium]